MANITKLHVSTADEKIHLSATSAGMVVKSDGTTTHHKLTNVKVDYANTFICNNGPSTVATTFPITAGFDEDITNFEMKFENLLVEDSANELFFVFLEETEYDAKKLYSGYAVPITNGYTVYCTDGTDYYTFALPFVSGNTFVASDQNAFETNMEHASDDYTVYMCNVGGSLYLLTIDKDGTKSCYYKDSASTVADILTYTKFVEATLDSTQTIEYFLGVTLSVRDFYDLLHKSIEIKDPRCCEVDCSTVDSMLAWNGFNLAKTLQEYRQMIYYWKVLHNGSSSISNCSCNG